jgi:hypothetical protein
MVLVLMTVTLSLPPRLEATSVIPPSFDELVEKAELIFEGKVTRVEAKWLGEGKKRRIKTDFTFEVLETLKGTAPATYTLQVLGGTVGEVTMEVDGAPRFRVGDRTLLFVTNNGTQFVPLVGIMHGHYEFKKDAATQQEIVVKHDGSTLHDLDGIGKDELAQGGRLKKLSQQGTAPMTPAMFKEKIRLKRQELTR